MITSNFAIAIAAALIVLVGYACRAIFKGTWAAFRCPVLFEPSVEGVAQRSRIMTEFLRAVVLAALAWGGTTWAARDGIVTVRSTTAALAFLAAAVVIAAGFYGLLFLGLTKRRNQANGDR
ncbi:hypothetical protein [Burkholderia cenocepacia]|uniref:hypothetical protein n=1 Tax=Burkholderia cenocepacia TaxID=95486 RepID=UPI002AB605C5|nr:hypothetical protein [Burkholderia cenocepacia]